jgi:peptidoglycan/LPS O-acetylase OafA/YrhL
MTAAPVLPRSLPPPAVPPREPKHLPALDGVRGLAILLVLFAHATVNVATGPWPTLPGRLYFTLCSFGWIGVDLFFVLSGFLITRILINTRAGPGYFRNFYARRALRIFPLYYGVLTVLFVTNALMGRHPPDADSSAWLWCYASNIALACKGGPLNYGDWFATGHFWSLAVEEQFYLLWPVVVLLCSPTALRRICLGCLLAALVLRVILVCSAANQFAVYLLTPCKMDALAAGAWLASAVHSGGVHALERPARTVAGGSGGALLYLVANAFQRGQWLPYDDAFMRTLGLSLLWAFFGAVLVQALAADPQSRTGRFFRSALLGWLGKYSYGIYVFNGLFSPLVLALVLRSTAGWDAFRQSLTYAAASATFALTAAWWSWQLYEMHWLRLKRLFAYPWRGRPSAGASDDPAATPAPPTTVLTS